MKQFALRTLWILLGYALASAATGLVVYIFLRNIPSQFGADALRNGIEFSYMITFFVVFFAAVPASLVVAWGEFWLWRMWWYYAFAGSIIGVVLGYGFSPPHWFTWLGLGFGPIAGLIYWSVAGRHAGLPVTGPRMATVVLFVATAVVAFALTWGPELLKQF